MSGKQCVGWKSATESLPRAGGAKQQVYGFIADLQCDGCHPRRLVQTAANLFLLGKLVSDVIMLPLCWALAPHFNSVWDSSLTFYSLAFAVLNDCNFVLVQLTSRKHSNRIPFALMCAILSIEMGLYAYNILFLLTSHSLGWSNGFVLSLALLHILYRAVVLIHYRGYTRPALSTTVGSPPNLLPPPAAANFDRRLPEPPPPPPPPPPKPLQPQPKSKQAIRRATPRDPKKVVIKEEENIYVPNSNPSRQSTNSLSQGT